MDDPTLNQVLQQLRQRTGRASLPSSFQQNVWRAIRQRRAAKAGWVPWWAALAEGLLMPRTVFASLTVAVALGVAMGARTSQPSADHAREALDLGVFGHEAPALPATLLAAKI